MKKINKGAKACEQGWRAIAHKREFARSGFSSEEMACAEPVAAHLERRRK
jgi:hypothetical protein